MSVAQNTSGDTPDNSPQPIVASDGAARTFEVQYMYPSRLSHTASIEVSSIGGAAGMATVCVADAASAAGALSIAVELAAGSGTAVAVAFEADFNPAFFAAALRAARCGGYTAGG